MKCLTSWYLKSWLQAYCICWCSSSCRGYFLDGWLQKKIDMYFYISVFDLIPNVLGLEQCYKPEKFKCIMYKYRFAEVVAD